MAKSVLLDALPNKVARVEAKKIQVDVESTVAIGITKLANGRYMSCVYKIQGDKVLEKIYGNIDYRMGAVDEAYRAFVEQVLLNDSL